MEIKSGADFIWQTILKGFQNRKFIEMIYE